MTAPEQNVALLIAYDGRGTEGWQRHPGNRTVQGVLEDTLRETLGVQGPIEGAGRTDRGAHANGQVASVRIPAEHPVEDVAEILNGALPDDIAIVRAAAVPPDFHARHSAAGKTYRYVIWPEAGEREECPAEHEGRVWRVKKELDVAAMAEAAPVLVGQLDFATFATPSGFDRASTVRTLWNAEVTEYETTIEIIFEAEGFLYKMVRNLVRGLVRVGEGKWNAHLLGNALKKRDRKAAPGSAPASGLYLDTVHYEPDPFAEPPTVGDPEPAEG